MGPGSYDVAPDASTKTVVKYEFSSKKTESRLPSGETEGPGPGEYNVIQPLIKPTFNQGKWKPKIPSKSKPSSYNKARRGRPSSNGDSASGQLQNVDIRIIDGPNSRRERQPSLVDVSSRPRTISCGSDKDSMRSNVKSGRTDPSVSSSLIPNKGNILHTQRKKAAAMLKELVKENNKQLRVPVLKILSALEKVKLFAVLSIDQLKRLSYLLDEEEHLAQTYIIRQGDQGDKFYIILSGTVICTINQADGGELPVMELGAFDYFGEKAILESVPRAANVIANENVKLLYIKKNDFELVFGKLAELIKQDALQREENSPTRVNYDVWAANHDPPLSPLPKKTTNADHHKFNEALDEDRKRRALSEERISDGDGDKTIGGHIKTPGKDGLATTATSVNTPTGESQNQSLKQTPSSYASLSPNKSSPSHDKNTSPNKTPSPLRVQTQSIHPDNQLATPIQKKAMSRRDSTSSDDKIARAAIAAAAAAAAKTSPPTAIAATTATAVSELDDSMQGYADDFDDDEGWDTIHE